MWAEDSNILEFSRFFDIFQVKGGNGANYLWIGPTAEQITKLWALQDTLKVEELLLTTDLLQLEIWQHVMNGTLWIQAMDTVIHPNNTITML